MPASLNLTGAWAAGDGAVYYIRHLDDNSIWWAGLHNSGFHLGLEFTNVFHGVVNVGNKTIEGSWADVPRGQNVMRQGHLSLDIVETASLLDKGEPPRSPERDGTPGPGPGPSRRLELRRRPEGTTGGFGGSVWSPWFSQDPVDIRDSYARVHRYDKLFSEDNAPFKDFAVVFGVFGGPPDNRVVVNWNEQPQDYCTFLRFLGTGECVDPVTHERSRCDGDITFSIENCTFDPDFWNTGWIESSTHWKEFFPVTPSAAARIQAHFDRHGRGFHCEIGMYGRTNDEDNCGAAPFVLLPGWMESRGNSVLVNGLPINGNVLWGPFIDTLFQLHFPETDRSLQMSLQTGARARVTGVINLDEHDVGFPSYAGRPEIHPVYSIDLIQDFRRPRPGADLTGVWHANDGGTYYLRQLGSEIWWLGLSRDQGRAFANVFSGTIAPDTATISISGEWADIPAGVGGARSSGRLALVGIATVGEGAGHLVTTLSAVERTGGFGGSRWQKLYDRPFR